MIKTVDCFTVICDNCGNDAMEGSEYSGFGDKDYVLECAHEAGFIDHQHNHYCSNCYEYDDEDNIVIKPN